LGKELVGEDSKASRKGKGCDSVGYTIAQ